MFVSLSALHHAIRAKEADRALEVAGKMKRVPLRYAARLTVLLADMKHPRYEAAARRFIVAFTEELEPPTMQVKKVADALAHVHHYYYAHFARDALQDLIGQSCTNRGARSRSISTASRTTHAASRSRSRS